jgi:formate-dependent nitrite reductase membrane component NrfD
VIDRAFRWALGVEPPDPHAAEREEAGAVEGERVHAVGYYGLPVLKRAHWQWHIPTYFFFSGLSAGAYVVATLADLFGSDEDRPVASAGRWLALVALLPCPPLLIDDLGVPSRFPNMLRIVKPRSPMSMGSWALGLFGIAVGASTLLELTGAPRALRRVAGLAGLPPAAFVGAYTGVLLSATAVPLWGRARAFLSPIFVLSGTSAGLAAISLALHGRVQPATEERLRDLETLALAGELALVSAAVGRLGPLARPLVARPYGPLFWGGSVALGQVAPLLLNVSPIKPPLIASILTLLGSLLTRFLIVKAGQESADDPQAAFVYHS